MYTIKTVASRTGVAATTIRAWERRYGVVAPERSPGGYRVYSERDVRAILRMAHLIGEGVAANLAADQVRAEEAPTSLAPHDPPAPGEAGHVLVRAAGALDAAGVRAELDRAFSGAGFEEIVDGWLRSALEDLGNAWARGDLDVAGEHFASQAIRSRLLAALDQTPLRPGAPRVVVAQASGVQHDLGLLSFAVAAQRRGLDVRFVGGDVPEADVISAMGSARATCLVTSVPRREDIEPSARLVAAVGAALPSVLLVAGGRFQDDLSGVLRLGHDVGPAARTLAERLGSETHPAG